MTESPRAAVPVDGGAGPLLGSSSRNFELRADTVQSGDAAQLVLICVLAGHAYGLSASAVERILRMSEISPLPDAPAGVVGVVNLQGTIYPVVDPRLSLQLPTVHPHPDQRLIVVNASSRYMLWVDDVLRIAPVRLHAATVASRSAIAPNVVNLDGLVVPILSVSGLEPGRSGLPIESAVL